MNEGVCNHTQDLSTDCAAFCQVRTNFQYGKEQIFPKSYCRGPATCTISENNTTTVSWTGKAQSKFVKALEVGVSGGYSTQTANATASASSVKLESGQCGYFAFVPITKSTCGTLTHAEKASDDGGTLNCGGNQTSIGNFCGEQLTLSPENSAKGETIFVRTKCDDAKPLPKEEQNEVYQKPNVPLKAGIYSGIAEAWRVDEASAKSDDDDDVKCDTYELSAKMSDCRRAFGVLVGSSNTSIQHGQSNQTFWAAHIETCAIAVTFDTKWAENCTGTYSEVALAAYTISDKCASNGKVCGRSTFKLGECAGHLSIVATNGQTPPELQNKDNSTQQSIQYQGNATQELKPGSEKPTIEESYEQSKDQSTEGSPYPSTTVTQIYGEQPSTSSSETSTSSIVTSTSSSETSTSSTVTSTSSSETSTSSTVTSTSSSETSTSSIVTSTSSSETSTSTVTSTSSGVTQPTLGSDEQFKEQPVKESSYISTAANQTNGEQPSTSLNETESTAESDEQFKEQVVEGLPQISTDGEQPSTTSNETESTGATETDDETTKKLIEEYLAKLTGQPPTSSNTTEYDPATDISDEEKAKLTKEFLAKLTEQLPNSSNETQSTGATEEEYEITKRLTEEYLAKLTEQNTTQKDPATDISEEERARLIKEFLAKLTGQLPTSSKEARSTIPLLGERQVKTDETQKVPSQGTDENKSPAYDTGQWKIPVQFDDKKWTQPQDGQSEPNKEEKNHVPSQEDQV
ncbi:MAG: hypothetical protein M1837_005651 [Sclerophora amabilis]|nr:MAG: hypothetical protein M1837_005651 [Sclerophora amabilis]